MCNKEFVAKSLQIKTYEQKKNVDSYLLTGPVTNAFSIRVVTFLLGGRLLHTIIISADNLKSNQRLGCILVFRQIFSGSTSGNNHSEDQ